MRYEMRDDGERWDVSWDKILVGINHLLVEKINERCFHS